MIGIKNRIWKIGEIAKRTGVTIRTLHHYDRIGLFSPHEVSETGHRLYSEADVAKLHHIMTLKQLGFALTEIKSVLDDPKYPLTRMLRVQVDRLNEQIEMLSGLRNRIQEIDGILQAGETVSSERFMMVIQYMKMVESEHFHIKQKEELKKLMTEWQPHEEQAQFEAGENLIAKFRSLYKRGISFDDPEVKELAKQWHQMVLSMPHTDEAFIRSTEQYYAQHPDEALAYGMDEDIYRYIKQAAAVITEA
ncbi:MerR family transcriptional regulator [Paenibacillus lautus]|uniref:MerR family transcriptional regulator n=1 Tax=Paenibacillus lautus TaxID=1401 RepID=UPI003D9A6B95